MLAAVCLTLSFIHGLTWLRLRKELSNAAFALVAFGTALFCITDLVMMKAPDIDMYGVGVRWLHVPAFIVIAALIWFIRLHFQAGRPWLGWLVIVIRALSLVLNFTLDFNLNYLEITAIQKERFLWDSVNDAQGIPNPWMAVGQISLFLLIAYILDAMVTVWRRRNNTGDRVLIGSIAFFVIASTVNAILVLWEVVPYPLTVSLHFIGVVFSMAFILSTRLIQSVALNDNLRESNERMSLATESVGLGIWKWDIPSNHVWSTQRWRELFDFPDAGTITYDDVLRKIHPDDRKEIGDRVRIAIDHGTLLVGEFRVQLPDGRERWIATRGNTHRGSDGRALHLLGVAVDITERKTMEMESQQNRAEIAHLSRVATMGELLGLIAHEINQPLTAILANAQAAQRFLGDSRIDLDEIRQIHADIASEGQRAGDTIHRLRALLKKGDFIRVPTDLNQTLQEALKLVRSECRQRNIRVDLHLAAGLPQVPLDPIQIQQVMVNLILNAAQAMDATNPDERVITITSNLLEDDQVNVSVSDRGSGIRPDILPHLFEPFMTTKSEGMGLGLRICKSIIESHGGAMRAENHHDGGAVLSFTISADSGKDMS